MARLVTKFKYLKPDQEKPIGGYATYIATREGVEKIDESFKLSPATVKQQKLIEKILRDFPDSAAMLEYEDYQREKTVSKWKCKGGNHHAKPNPHQWQCSNENLNEKE